jgi:signal peptidase I
MKNNWFKYIYFAIILFFIIMGFGTCHFAESKDGSGLGALHDLSKGLIYLFIAFYLLAAYLIGYFFHIMK